MSDVIRLLPDSVANQIAAGEVIQRPASVLKELVENALDAGASVIRVQIKDAGRTLIAVSDDGKGMSDTDARMAFERHATSKISDAQDLFHIRTMGFRGEALASIAAVAQVEMRTRRSEDELGTFVEIAGSRVFRQEIVQCDKGTSFHVKNLFFNVPARRRFLKSDSVEKNHLLNEFYRIVLVNPEVEFYFYDGDDEVFYLPVSNVKVRIDQVFGNFRRKMSQQLLSLEAETSLVSIHGFIGRPEFAQKSTQQYFFVNGRYMRHPYFHKALMMAYSQLISPGDNPPYFIYFEVDPQTIDINIHPTKTEIKFENEQAIWSILTAAVKESLGKFNIVPSIDFDREEVPELPTLQRGAQVTPPPIHFNASYNPFSDSQQSGSYSRPPVNWDSLFRQDDRFEKPSENEHIQQVISKEAQTSGAYFQLKERYIITSVKSGMMLIDQRRAHVRILFDEFMSELSLRKGFSQQLLFPEVIELMPGDLPFYEQIKDELRILGFDIKVESGGLQLLVQGIPSRLKSPEKVNALFSDILLRTKSAYGEPMEKLREEMALTLAETSAIPPTGRLSAEEMANLVEQLFACPVHLYTPDGKTVMVIISQDEIANRFN
ncbi:MAG: DNA mismatch repair endonuclease MutL [Paludibacter sp.]|jgi:DNA mismatch repair protein MutL|nr:DNA mismatch repair endonuclease MutL [Paludibacter sp.]